MAHEESTEVEDGKILYQRRKGYKMKGRLLRPSTVVVAKAKADETTTEKNQTERLL